jgi:glycerate 2-kinase
MFKRFIRNADKLGVTRGRRDALAIIEAGLAAVETRKAVGHALKLKGKFLEVGGRIYDLSSYRRIYVIGFGKASFAAAAELEKILGSRITEGIVLDVKGGKLKRIRSIVGTHPLPTEKNVKAAGEITKLLESADSEDLIITVVSGGGSALLCRPSGIKCGELALVTKMLMRRGADIREMNTVRKHLSEILGGHFAKLAYPATVLGLIFSDVPGDDLGMISSGPTVKDRSTVREAAKVLEKYGIVKSFAFPGCDLSETPKDAKFFRRVHNVLVVANRLAAEAMRAEAERRGYASRILSVSLQGEARRVGKRLALLPRPGEAVIAAGETTVTVKGKGKGGRNGELALGALMHVKNKGVVVSCASDGHDNSESAGALVDALIMKEARSRKLDPRRYLEDNDSFSFMSEAGGLIMAGNTGINVSDLMLSLRE